jgi:CheY-like chemotaxis protein
MQVESSLSLFSGRGLRVLVVEDNASLGLFAIEMLTDLGYESVLASNAQAALDRLAEDADYFHVVFTDVVMPGMSGIELAQRVRSLYPDLPVVLTSGYSHVLARNGTYGFELLHKPYSLEQVSQVLQKAAVRTYSR